MHINKNQKSSRQLNKIAVLTAWVASIWFLNSHIFHCIKNDVGNNFYKSFCRELWSASFCWIIYACHHLKSGGLLREFLSQNFWQPLSKLCLSVYLTHYIYLMMTNYNQKEFQLIGSWWKVHIQIGDIFICFFIGGLFYLIVEAPTAKLVQHFLARSSRQTVDLKETEKLNATC